MALPETSPLDDSLARILGQPATTSSAQTPVAQPTTSPINYGLGSAGGLTTTALGAEQPYVVPAAVEASAPLVAPVATTPAAPPAAPLAIDETLIRNHMADAGFSQQAIDSHIAGVFSHGATPYYSGVAAKTIIAPAKSSSANVKSSTSNNTGVDLNAIPASFFAGF